MLNKRPWWLFLAGALVILAGLVLANTVQTSGGIAVKSVHYDGGKGKTIRALLYVPKSATPATKAPGILAMHGYINSREVQSGFAIEFARRGYVVLTPDQSGHGYSDAPAFANGFGGPASLAYLRTLDMVDTDNIGLEGHSMGGWAVLAAAAVMPDAYKSMVLLGSSTGAPFAAEGSTTWPRNLELVFSRFDEFSMLMWGAGKARDVRSSPKLMTLFGAGKPVFTGKLYGDIDTGSARVLYQPRVTHPGDHLSRAAIGHTINWFAQTLDGGTSFDSADQIWPFKEAGTLIAFIGFVMLVLGTFQALLRHRFFASLVAEPSAFAYEGRTIQWWSIAIVSAIIPAATFYPFFKWSEALLPASALLPQLITTQVAFWAVLNGIIAMLIGLVIRTTTVHTRNKIVLSMLIALASMAVGYVVLWLASVTVHLDFRFWFVGLKLLSWAQAKIALVYLVPFGVYCVFALRAVHLGLSVRKDRAWLRYLSNALVMMGGLFGFLLLQYGVLFTRGALLTPAEPLNTIVMLQFVPIVLIVSVISTFTYARTSNIWPGAFINTLLITWYVVAGQATQFAAP